MSRAAASRLARSSPSPITSSVIGARPARLQPDRANQRMEILDRIQPRHGADHYLVIGDSQLAAELRSEVAAGQRPDLDAVVDDVHFAGGEALRHQMLFQIGGDGHDLARRMGEHPVGGATLRRRRRVGQPPVLGEDDSQIGRPQPGDGGVDERRVVMTVDHLGTVPRRDPGDGVTELRLKAVAARQRGDADILAAEPFAPAAGLVQTANGHRKLRPEASHDFDDETLGSAWIEAQDDLKHVERTAWHQPLIVASTCFASSADVKVGFNCSARCRAFCAAAVLPSFK